MYNLLFGIVVVIMCVVVVYIAYKRFINQRYTVAVFCLMFCGLVLRTYTATDMYLHRWDERFHALVAKNLIQHPLTPTLYENNVLQNDYRNWAVSHVWLHKQPLPLWTMATSMWLFGVNEWALRLPSVLLSTLGIWFMWRIGVMLWGARVGFIAAFLYAIHGLVIELAGGRVATDHIDVFFLFFVQLGVYFAIRWATTDNIMFNIACGISVGAAILCKWLPALIVLPIWYLLMLHYQRRATKNVMIQLGILLLTIVAVALPWQIYIHAQFPLEASWEQNFNMRHITEVLEKHQGSAFFHWHKMRMLFGEIIYLPLVWLLWKTWKKPSRYKRWILLLWILVPYLFFSFVKTKMQGYTLFTAPAIFLLTAISVHYLLVFRYRFRHKWLVYAVVLLLLGLPIRYSIERTKPFELRERSPQWANDARHLARYDHKTVLFNIEYAIEAMFYTSATAFEHIPDVETVNLLAQKGYTIVINQTDNIPTWLLNDKRVSWIHVASYPKN